MSTDRRRPRMNQDRVWVSDGYGSGYEARWVRSASGTHVCSEMSDGNHLPVLDVDATIFSVVPSSTPGHQHVYIDRPMTWRQYKKLMKLLAKAGIVDDEWRKMTERRGAGYLRVVPKPPTTPPPPKVPLPRPLLGTLVQEPEPPKDSYWG